MLLLLVMQTCTIIISLGTVACIGYNWFRSPRRCRLRDGLRLGKGGFGKCLYANFFVGFTARVPSFLFSDSISLFAHVCPPVVVCSRVSLMRGGAPSILRPAFIGILGLPLALLFRGLQLMIIFTSFMVGVLGHEVGECSL